MDIAEKLSQARACIESGDVAGGEQWCRSLLDESPDCADALHFLAVARLQSGRPDEAVAHAEAGHRRRRRQSAVSQYAGRRPGGHAEVRRGRWALSPGRRDGSRVRRRPSQSGQGPAGDWPSEQAADCYRAAIGLQPENPEIHYDLGNALRAMNRFDEAVASYREAVRLRPDYVKAYTNLGGTLRDLKRFGEADGVLSSDRAIPARRRPGIHEPGRLGHEAKGICRGRTTLPQGASNSTPTGSLPVRVWPRRSSRKTGSTRRRRSSTKPMLPRRQTRICSRRVFGWATSSGWRSDMMRPSRWPGAFWRSSPTTPWRFRLSAWAWLPRENWPMP